MLLSVMARPCAGDSASSGSFPVPARDATRRRQKQGNCRWPLATAPASAGSRQMIHAGLTKSPPCTTAGRAGSSKAGVEAQARPDGRCRETGPGVRGAKSTVSAVTRGGWRSEEHTSELTSLMRLSYDVFCLKKEHKQPTPCRHHALNAMAPR